MYLGNLYLNKHYLVVTLLLNQIEEYLQYGTGNHYILHEALYFLLNDFFSEDGGGIGFCLSINAIF